MRIVAWDRRRAATMPRRSPLSSVMPADSIATSVPVPIAMPTSAAASAGASLTPSPAMATTRPSFRKRFNHLAFVLRQNLRFDFRNAKLARHDFRRRSIVAGEHHDADTRFLQRANGLKRGRLDRVGHSHHAGRLAVDRGEDCGRAVDPQIIGRGFKSVDVNFNRLHQSSIAERDFATLDGSGHPFARNAFKALNVAQARDRDPPRRARPPPQEDVRSSARGSPPA